MKTKKIKIISGTLLLLIVTAFTVALPTSELSLKAANAPQNSPITIVSLPSDNDLNIFSVGEIDTSSWDAFTTSIKATIDDIYGNAEDFVNMIRDYIMDSYGSIENYIQDMIDSYKSTSSS